MSYGYIGDTSTSIKQQVKNAGVLSMSDVVDLKSKGHLGGSLELISEQTVSSVANVQLTSIKESNYDVHLLQVFNYQPAALDRLGMQFYESGVLETGNVYKYAYQYGYYSGTFGENKSTGDNHLKVTPDETTTAGESSSSYTYIYNAGNSSHYTFTTAHLVGSDFFRFGGGLLPQASTVDGLYLFGDFSGSNFSATIKLYGVKQL